MKIRNGFVSNSSSSSFIISRSYLTDVQIEQIKNHSALGKELRILFAEDSWTVVIDEISVSGWTDMNNFDMQLFFKMIGIDNEKVKWEFDG